MPVTIYTGEPPKSKRRRELPPPEPQFPPGRQCPHCGGYKIYVQKEESHGDYTDGSFGAFVHGSTLAFLFFLALLLVLMISVIGAPFAWLLNRAMDKSGYVESFKSYDYGCSLCGYTWHWSTLAPWPVVMSRPELAALGEQRLQQAQRQQQDADALYVLTHQDK